MATIEAKYSPMLVSYACKYSDVMNWETSELLPTAVSPSISTLPKRNSKIKCNVLIVFSFPFFLKLRMFKIGLSVCLSNSLSNCVLRQRTQRNINDTRNFSLFEHLQIWFLFCLSSSSSCLFVCIPVWSGSWIRSAAFSTRCQTTRGWCSCWVARIGCC